MQITDFNKKTITFITKPNERQTQDLTSEISGSIPGFSVLSDFFSLR